MIFPEDPDYNDLYDKAINRSDSNCFFIVYDNNELIGITGVDVYSKYQDTIWLDWFGVIESKRRKGYGKKILLDTINYCKELKKYTHFRVDTTYYENRALSFLYDQIMHLKEDYTIEDTDDYKSQTIIYSYAFNGKAEAWNNKYLGLTEYYDKCQDL